MKKWASSLFFLGLSLLALATWKDYGVSWDEIVVKNHGVIMADWYATMGNSTAILEKVYRFYGGFFSFLAFGAATLLPGGFYAVDHMLVVLFGLLAIAGVWRIGVLIGGPRAGLLSAAALALFPRFYGHMFINPKDVPFAAMFVWAVYFILKSTDLNLRLKLRPVFLAALFISLTLGIRMAGLVLFAYAGFYWAVCWLSASAQTRSASEFTRFGPLGFSGMIFLSLLLTLPWWPYLQTNFFGHFSEIIQETASWTTPFSVLYRGQYVLAADLPRTYLPLWFLMVTPEFYFLIFLGGGVVLLQEGWAQWKKRDSLSLSQCRGLTVGAVALGSVASAVILKPVIFDGIRHFLFVAPFLAVLAGLGLDAILKTSQFSPPLKKILLAAVVIGVGLPGIEMIRLHPYQYIYFNRLFGGGLPLAAENFPTDYHGTAHKEGLEWIVNNPPPERAEPYRISNCTDLFLFDTYLKEDPKLAARFKAVKPDDNPEIFLATTRWGCHQRIPGRAIYAVKREGVPLLYVMQVKTRSKEPKS